jgi:hypothetical protein
VIHLKIRDKSHAVNPATDPLGRDRLGYADGMGDWAFFDVARGPWVLDERKVASQPYAVVSHDGRIKGVLRIDRLAPSPVPGKVIIIGAVLDDDDPIARRYLSQPAPDDHKNPVTYFEAPEDLTCLCGCGQRVVSGDFLPGHDQRAIHDRTRQIGTVAEFLYWFDATHGYWPGLNVVFERDGRVISSTRHRLGCSHVTSPDNVPRTATPEEMATVRPCESCRDAVAR